MKIAGGVARRKRSTSRGAVDTTSPMPAADLPAARDAGSSFRGLVLRSVVLPFLMMVLLAGLLVGQIGRLRAAAGAVEHTDRVLTALYQFKLQLLDMQSSVRGFLYARGDEAFLAPYDGARAGIDRTFDELVRLTADRADAQRLLAEIGPRYRAYVALLDERVARGRAGHYELPPDFKTFATQIADLRARIRQLADDETALRADRNARAERESRITLLGGGGVVLAVGAALAYLSRVQLRQLARTYEAALARALELSQTLERRVEERTAEVTRANGRLAEANKELEAFAYSISHDLRAPMRHITGFANLVRASARDKLSGDDVENLDTIRDTAMLAGRMVDDLLAFSRVGRTQLRRAPVDMNALVRRSIDELGPEVAGRQIEWAVGDLPPAVGDPALLKMVWQNLLANAVKYTGKQAKARIEVGGDRGADGTTTYYVKDNGVGFDMAYAHKLFGVFQRLHRAEEFEGTGIGLANVRRIILRHDGQVSVDGKLNEGATFSFRLPDRPTDPEGTAA